MPSILSKLLMPEWSLPYNCYEVGHTWTPSCEEAALDVSARVFYESLKLYTPLYLYTLIMSKKYDKENFNKMLVNIFRSSAFLGFSGLATMTVFCALRRVAGKFYYTLCAYIPVFFSCCISILIEKPSRRGALAIYTANIASETIYRMLVRRGQITPIPHGEIMLFTGTAALLLYLIRKHGYGRDSVSLALKIILGREEGKLSSTKKIHFHTDENANKLTSWMNGTKRNYDFSRFLPNFPQFKALNDRLPKHETCKHGNYSCPINALMMFSRNFIIGWSTQLIMSLASKPKLFLASPRAYFMTKARNSTNVQFALFMASFTAVYKSVNCWLRWYSNGTHDWHAFVSGIFAGPCMLFSPNTTIVMYLLWRCIETVYMLGVKKGLFGAVNQTVVLLYAAATAQIAYAIVLEPSCMRPSYLKFIDQITGYRLKAFNRLILDVFGTGASIGHEDFWPDLLPQHISRQFQENVINWLI